MCPVEVLLVFPVSAGKLGSRPLHGRRQTLCLSHVLVCPVIVLDVGLALGERAAKRLIEDCTSVFANYPSHNCIVLAELRDQLCGFRDMLFTDVAGTMMLFEQCNIVPPLLIVNIIAFPEKRYDCHFGKGYPQLLLLLDAMVR